MSVWLFLPAPGDPVLVDVTGHEDVGLDLLTDAVQLWPWTEGDVVVFADDPAEAGGEDNVAASRLAGVGFRLLRGHAVAMGVQDGRAVPLTDEDVRGWQARLAADGLPSEVVSLREALVRREVAARVHGGEEPTPAELDAIRAEFDRPVSELAARSLPTLHMRVTLVEDERGS